MKIAILGSRGFPSTYGGFETLVRYLARDLTRQGNEVYVYCRSRTEGRRMWECEGVRCVWTPGIDTKSLSTLTYGFTSVLDAGYRGFDAVLVLNVAHGFFLPFLRRRGIPIALNTDGLEWERGKWGTTARQVFLAGAKLSARLADVLIADSVEIERIWAERFGVRSVFIPYGAPILTEVSCDLIDRLELAPDGYVLIVARLIPENNVELLLDAVDLIAQRPRLVVVGSANFASPLETRLQAAERRGDVMWLGHVSDQELLSQLWAHAAVYLHGHSVGGTNPGLLQAMGAGAPTLALDTAFNREVLGDERHLFPPSAVELAARLDELLTSPNRRREFGVRAQDIIRERYQWSDVCADYLEALVEARRVITGHSASRPRGQVS